MVARKDPRSASLLVALLAGSDRRAGLRLGNLAALRSRVHGYICAVCWRAAYREGMFFEPLPAGEDPAPGGLPELPPRSGPPPLETGAGLAGERTPARTPIAPFPLPTIPP